MGKDLRRSQNREMKDKVVPQIRPERCPAEVLRQQQGAEEPASWLHPLEAVRLLELTRERRPSRQPSFGEALAARLRYLRSKR